MLLLLRGLGVVIGRQLNLQFVLERLIPGNLEYSGFQIFPGFFLHLFSFIFLFYFIEDYPTILFYLLDLFYVFIYNH